MPRRKRVNEEVQNEEKLDEVQNDLHNDIQEPKENNQVNPGDKETKQEIINIGSRVKVKPELSNDILGRRVHAGLKNYVYTVINIRPDGYLIIKCLTYQFTVKKSDVIPLISF